MSSNSALHVLPDPENPEDFATPNQKAKSAGVDIDAVAKRIHRIVREEHLDYEQLRYLFRKVRSLAGIRQKKKQRKLPKLLSDAELNRFFDDVQAGGSVEHQIMLKLLFFTAIRVSELVSIKVADVDLGNCKIFIDQGKGSKDRNVLFPESFRLALAGHLAANPRNKFLFESGQCRPYSTRRIQQIITEYGQRAGIKIHCHLLRHQMLTWLTRSGLTDAQIQLISGHSSKKSLEVYQHLGLGCVSGDYQDAVRKIE
jgi:integrase/recombinase XerD